MTNARKHLATRWHISSSSGGGSILRCYCGDWESDPKATTYVQRAAHRAHRVEMGETVAPSRPSVSDRLKAAEDAIARIRDLHKPFTLPGYTGKFCDECCDGHGSASRWPCSTLAALDTPKEEPRAAL